MRSVRARIERVGHAANRIVDEDRLERLFARTENAETFEALLAARATFTIAIKHAGDAINDAIAVAERLDSLGNGFRGIRRVLDSLAAKTLGCEKHDVRVRRWRRSTFGSLNDSMLFDNNAFRGLLRK